MKRFPLAACAGLLALAMATPSFAADLPRPAYKSPYKTPIYAPPAFSWTGFYAGINAGYGWGTSNWTSVATAGGTSPKGGLAGMTVGYNLQTGNWVWGLEGDFDYSWIKGSTATGIGNCSGAGCETKVPWLATTRGRVGYAWDRWMAYFTGGAAFASIKMTPNNALSTSDTQIGWTLGGGVEYAFLGNWSAKLEYLYADLGDATCETATCGAVATSVSYDTSIVRAGLNYRF